MPPEKRFHYSLNIDFHRLSVFLGLNFCLSLFIGMFYLLFAGGHPLELAYVSTALVSNTVMLSLVLWLAAVPLFLFATGRFLLVILAGLFQLTLVTDVIIYKIFKFHLNSMVLNLVLTPGGLESLDQGWGTKALFVLLAGVLGATQWYFWRLSGAWSGPSLLRRRRALTLAGVLMLFVVTDKGLFAWGTLYDSSYITRNVQLLPLYLPLKISTFASKYLGVKLDQEVKGGLDLKYSGLDYPKRPLEIAPPGQPLNFLIIIVDSLRADMFSPEVMPETWALGEKSAMYANHHSGGNCTRFGIFSILYGIYGNYWFPMLGERRGPALIDVLTDQDYDLRLFASAKLSFPEFNKTCFVNVPRPGIYDEPVGRNGAERDRDITDQFMAFLLARDPKTPYFSFIFYDASHGDYDSPPDFEKFKPATGVSQLALNKENVGGLFNKYKNSISFEDSLLGRIIRALDETGGLKDTVVLVTGDHGEAFLEHGYQGHNQGYSPEEVRVPLVLYVPGLPPRRVDALTSHLDIVPTLMPLAGVKNPEVDYSSGRSLLETGPRPYAALASWHTAGIMKNGLIIEMPLQAYKGGLKIFDGEYREIPRKSVASELSPLILQFQKEAKRFSK